jgi:hypothetical protein
MLHPEIKQHGKYVLSGATWTKTEEIKSSEDTNLKN